MALVLCDYSIFIWREDAQGSDLASIFDNLSKSEKLSDIKPPLAVQWIRQKSNLFTIQCRGCGCDKAVFRKPKQRVSKESAWNISISSLSNKVPILICSRQIFYFLWVWLFFIFWPKFVAKLSWNFLANIHDILNNCNLVKQQRKGISQQYSWQCFFTKITFFWNTSRILLNKFYAVYKHK